MSKGQPLAPLTVAILTSLALLAFAGNSLLCRLAFTETTIDAASFTGLRLLSGAVVLCLLTCRKRVKLPAVLPGDWISALALFIYATGFSYAYIQLEAGMGALLLFGAVQVTMISYGLWRGERLVKGQSFGLVLAILGLGILLWPGSGAEVSYATMLMLAAGIAWGVYSLRGKGIVNPLRATTGNFIRTLPLALVLSLITLAKAQLDLAGIGYAMLSGALTSGIGYAIWYTALPYLKATIAATSQLAVPLLAAVAGVALLNEPVTPRLVIAALAISAGISFVIFIRHKQL